MKLTDKVGNSENYLIFNSVSGGLLLTLNNILVQAGYFETCYIYGMKWPKLLSGLIGMICCFATYYTTANLCARRLVVIGGDTLAQHAKPKLSLIIDEISTSTIYRIGAEKSIDSAYRIRYFLINNTNDTLIYTSTGSQYSKFYLTDNVELKSIDNAYWELDSIKRIVLLPHRGIIGDVQLKISNAPDTGFKFKIGMRMLKWEQGGTKAALSRLAREKVDTVWSDARKLKKDNWPASYQSYEAMKQEVIARSLKKPLRAFFPPITDDDRKKYILNIDQDKMLKLKDTLTSEWNVKKKKFYKRKRFFTTCPVKLTNNTADTLQYMSMDCSWREIYRVKADNYSIAEGPSCFKNVPTTIKVLPYQSRTVYITLVTDRETNLSQKIKIGMSLQKYWGRDQIEMFFLHQDALMVLPDISNMIWSNEVEVP